VLEAKALASPSYRWLGSLPTKKPSAVDPNYNAAYIIYPHILVVLRSLSRMSERRTCGLTSPKSNLFARILGANHIRLEFAQEKKGPIPAKHPFSRHMLRVLFCGQQWKNNVTPFTRLFKAQ